MRVTKLFSKSLLIGIVGGLSLLFTACSNETDSINPPFPPDIPLDEDVSDNPVIDLDKLNTLIPNFNYSVSKEGDWYVIRLDMTGVQDPFTKDWVQLYGPATPDKQNIWLSIDDMKKGFSITKETTQSKAVDLVFLVDNSGSMSQEANTLATQVLAWSKKLEASGLDIRFGLVGYDGRITGGINLGTIDDLDKFLNNGSTGTSRTMHFESKVGDDWNTWCNKYYVNNAMDECGVAALRLADENFNFRTGANRVYVNFTDEPNYPCNNPGYSTEWVKDITNWPATKGTIHTVFSDNNYTNWTQSINYEEYPWNLSDYTGGTKLFTNSSFYGINLDDLPVTGALLNTYIIRFTNIEDLFDGQPHQVHITVNSTSPNGEILADKVFSITFVKP